VKVGPVKQLPPGSARIVQWEDQPVIVLDLAGRIVALSAVCTHQGCTVEWDADDGVIQCPCHGSQFDTSGKVIRGPAPAPLFAVTVQVKDGEIYLPTDP
jgi:cytochrome b6-f complex iron-sulfur subunit